MTDIVNYLEEKKMSEYENFKKRLSIEEIVYDKMCMYCPNAKKCHEECESCDEFYEEVDRLESLLTEEE